jgi:hypothetical protein
MISKKQKIIFAAIVAGIAVLIPLGLYIAGRLYFSEKRMYEQNWDIRLPDGMKAEYKAQTPTSFRGDGVRCTVYKLKTEPSAFIADFQSATGKEAVWAVADALSRLDVAADQLPRWSDAYLWKRVSNHSGLRQDQYAGELYMLYFPNPLKLILCQITT